LLSPEEYPVRAEQAKVEQAVIPAFQIVTRKCRGSGRRHHAISPNKLLFERNRSPLVRGASGTEVGRGGTARYCRCLVRRLLWQRLNSHYGGWLQRLGVERNCPFRKIREVLTAFSARCLCDGRAGISPAAHFQGPRRPRGQYWLIAPSFIKGQAAYIAGPTVWTISAIAVARLGSIWPSMRAASPASQTVACWTAYANASLMIDVGNETRLYSLPSGQSSISGFG
jgi:hypothetical protein